MRKRLLSTLLALCMMLALLPGTAWAEDDVPTSGKCGDDVTWYFNASTQTLTLTGSGTTNFYGWYYFQPPAPWEALADQIKFIRVEGSITELGGGLFESCTSAIEISLPKTLEEYYLFTFPYTLQRFVTEANSVRFLADNGVLYTKSETGSGYDLIYYPSGKQSSSYTLRSDTNVITGYGFYDNPYITKVVLNDTLSKIGLKSFEFCTSLTEITIPDSVKELAGLTFCGCTNLTSVTLPKGMTKIDNSAFWLCENLSRLDIPDTVRDFTCNCYPGEGWSPESSTDLSVYFYSYRAPEFDTGLLVCRSDGKVTIYYPENAVGWEEVQNQEDVRQAVSDGSMEFKTWAYAAVPDMYAVSFNLNGGTGYIPPMRYYEAGTYVSMPSEIPTRDGYIFEGWWDGSQLHQPGESVQVIDRDIMLTAGWKENDANMAYVQRLTACSLAQADEETKTSVQNAVYNLLFKAQYRPTESKIPGDIANYTGSLAVNSTWPIQNKDYGSKVYYNKTITDNVLDTVKFAEAGAGCMAYALFATAYTYGTSGTSIGCPDLSATGIKSFIHQYVDPGEQLRYCHRSGTHNGDKGQEHWSHSIVFLGESSDGSGFYFISYNGGEKSSGATDHSLYVGYHTYQYFSNIVHCFLTDRDAILTSEKICHTIQVVMQHFL